MPLKEDTMVLPVAIVHQDKTMSCWLASAQMIISYRSISQSIVNSTNIETMCRYMDNHGLSVSSVEKFASEIGLNFQPSNLLLNKSDHEGYKTTLHRVGPIWVAGAFAKNGRGHAVVIVGVSGEKLAINDPNPSKSIPIWMEIAEFNNKLYSNIPMLYKLGGGIF